MNKRLVSVLHNANNPSLFLLVTMLLEDDKQLIIQKALNNIKNGTVTEDGIVGYNTIKAIVNTDEDVFATAIMDYALNKSKLREGPVTGKEKIMAYLGTYEGVIIHWNKNETDITTPYGVYGKHFPKSAPINYVQKMAVKYTGRYIKHRDRKQIAAVNLNMTAIEKKKIKDLCWDFYLANFMDKRVIPLLGAKSNLSYFSCSVNAGKKRGVMNLQSAVLTKPDGVLGNMTLKAIKRASSKGININDGILDAMLKFYKFLISKRPKRFGRFKNGWFNRIKGLR